MRFGFCKYIVPLLFLAVACTCPENLDENVDTQGDEAFVMFINAISEESNYEISADNDVIVSSFLYNENFPDYKEITYGWKSIVLKNSGSVVYKGLTSLEQGSYYTMIMYKNGSKISPLLYKDSDINSFLPDSSYMRAVHLSPEAPDMNVIISGVTERLLKAPNNGGNYFDIPLFPFRPGRFNVYIMNNQNSTIIKTINDFEFKPGWIYTLIVKGDYKEGESSSLNVQLIGKEYNKQKKGT
jgi:hypothetical protein